MEAPGIDARSTEGLARRIGIVGYGVGGKYFHAPFIQAAEGVELVGVVARSDDKQAAVIADKPFAPNAAAARELEDEADRAGVILNMFHNRRRDADILTLAGVVASGRLGELCACIR